jgi:hypothetical protein
MDDAVMALAMMSRTVTVLLEFFVMFKSAYDWWVDFTKPN